MMSGRKFRLALLCCCSVFATAVYAADAHADADSDSGFGGLGQFDLRLQHLRNAIRDSQEASTTLGANYAGRTLRQDLDALVLTPETAAKLDALRRQAASPGGESDAASGLAALYEGGALLTEEVLRLQKLREYWDLIPTLRYLRSLWQAQLTLVPAEMAAASTQRIDAAEQKAWATRGVPDAAQARATLDPALTAVQTAYNAERQDLAYYVAFHPKKEPAEVATTQRMTPCPAPSPEDGALPAERSPKSVRMGDLSTFYPKSEQDRAVEGRVILTLRISPAGCVVSSGIRASSGDSLLDEAGLKFVETMEYLPALHDGKPAEAYTDIAVKFALVQKP
jgi:TonB family protein